MASTKKKRTIAKPKQAASTKKSMTVSGQNTASAKKAAAKLDSTAQPADLLSSSKKPLFDLQQWNKWLAWIFALQGVAIVLFGASRLLPVSSSYLTSNPLVSGSGALVPATHHLFDVSLGWMIAIIFFISAAAHTLVATIYRKRYDIEIGQGINRIRWIDYGLSFSIILVVVAMLCGVYDLMALIAIFVLGLIAQITGLAMEVYNQGKQHANWLAYGLGCIAGVVPWIIIAFYLFGANVYGSGHIAGYIYAVFGSMFVLMAASNINQYLQYKKKGKWAGYAYSERIYMVLSLIAKTALAWQIFAGTLHP